MNIVNFPSLNCNDRDDIAVCSDVEKSERQAIRKFALDIATQLRNDSEINSNAPYLVDKVIMLLVKESRCF